MIQELRMMPFLFYLSRQQLEQEINISLDASTIIKKCKCKKVNQVPRCSLVNDCSLPDPPVQQLSKQQLLPPTKNCYIKNKEEAFHPELQETCLKHPIVIIRGLCRALQLDLSLFDTETVVKTNPELIIERRDQISHASDENWHELRKEKVWKFPSYLKHTTISKYAKYQAKILKRSNKRNGINDNVSISDDEMTEHDDEMVKFATNVDISVAENPKWKPQVKELKKLPPFLRVKCNDNMLSYVGHDILGMNTVQLYMKVPGCRTPGHQENNNFCSVNINIGPGDCEWFAVPNDYWSVIHSLCEQNDIDYLRDSWWPPDLNALHEKNIPVYRFYQKAGDVVWVNVGCVHWVHAINCCNNIAWNVGPFTAEQYQLAIERYEWNKVRRYQSVVPMVQLSWNLAHRAKVSNRELFELIKNCLLQTMKQNYLLRKFIKRKGIKVRNGDHKYDHIFYCKICEVYFPLPVYIYYITLLQYLSCFVY
ncbi:histone demethylase UTY [Monomorium pharaonis]|uniref:histone demethylase UTY n=1 Tax=Monomorium pharaonis TaxID=307658 RepID=UPI001747AB65|nr:histone demethylase UTY [Monomorium pharaonis]